MGILTKNQNNQRYKMNKTNIKKELIQALGELQDAGSTCNYFPYRIII